jgi:hypothetical protein
VSEVVGADGFVFLTDAVLFIAFSLRFAVVFRLLRHGV